MLKPLALLFSMVALQAPSPSEDPDIFLATLARRDGKLIVGAPQNITRSPGYDNQPSFTRDGRQILFTSARGAAPQPAGPGACPAPATDITRSKK